MNLLKSSLGLATAGALFASFSQPAVAVGNIEITKVSPEGAAKTKRMQFEVGGRIITGLVDATPALTNADIRDVSPITEKTKVTSGAKPETREVGALRVRFNPEGAKKWAALCKEWQGKQIVVIVDGQIIAAPRLTTSGTSGELIFSGTFTADQSRTLAANLNAKEELAPIAESIKAEKKKKR
jgi:preprotein translocase subunit SecD